MFTYIGVVVGDLLSGPFSQELHSRRRAIGIMMGLTLLFVIIYLYGGLKTTGAFYTACIGMGFAIGYIALFLTVAAESFGTNLRATATTSIANNVRATTLLTIPAFQALKVNYGVINAAALVGAFCFAIGFWSLAVLRETYGKDLEYTES